MSEEATLQATGQDANRINHYRNRIIEHTTEDPNSLLANPFNWRVHTMLQRKSVDELLLDVGWIDEVLVNDTTGHIVDGHLRVELALAGDEKTVPVRHVRLTEDEEKLVLSTKDATVAMAYTDYDVHRSLVDSIWAKGDEHSRSILQAIRDAGAIGAAVFKNIEKGQVDDEGGEELPADSVGGEASVLDLKMDVKFPSTNKLGIPDLIPEMIWDPTPFAPAFDIGIFTGLTTQPHDLWMFVYKNASRTGIDPTKCILSFYCYDEAFMDVWEETDEVTKKFLAEGWEAIVSPNFSIWASDPPVVQHWRTYMGKWVARYWQAAGFKVIPDIEWIDEETFEFNLLGVPKFANSVSIQLHTKENEASIQRNREMGIRKIVDTISPRYMLVYGASPEWKLGVSAICGQTTKPIFLQSINQHLAQVIGKGGSKKKRNGGEAK